MKHTVLSALAFLFFSQAYANVDAASDEAVCALNSKHMEMQVANAQVIEMVTAIKSVLIDAYKEMNIDITEKQITFLSPNTTIKQREDMDGFEMTTEMLANVSAGQDSIQALGRSTINLERVTDRQSTLDKIGRVVETKLICSVTANYYETEVSNANGGYIGAYNDAKDFDFSVELP